MKTTKTITVNNDYEHNSNDDSDNDIFYKYK